MHSTSRFLLLLTVSFFSLLFLFFSPCTLLILCLICYFLSHPSFHSYSSPIFPFLHLLPKIKETHTLSLSRQACNSFLYSSFLFPFSYLFQLSYFFMIPLFDTLFFFSKIISSLFSFCHTLPFFLFCILHYSLSSFFI